MPAPYERRYRHIDRRAIHTTRLLVRTRPWGRDAAALASARTWASRVAEVYGIEVPTVIIDRRHPDFRLFGDSYRPMNRTIVLGTFSVVSLAHEFRHHWQQQTGAHLTTRADAEDDARAWSLSLFRAAAPRRFARMAAAGRIHFVDAGEWRRRAGRAIALAHALEGGR